MAKIAAHEFITLDGVFSDPSWTAPYGFPDEMADAIAALTSSSSGILLGRTTFEMFAPAWSNRTAEDDPAPFAGFYNRGLTLYETAEPFAGLAVVRFKVKSRRLLHTLQCACRRPIVPGRRVREAEQSQRDP